MLERDVYDCLWPHGAEGLTAAQVRCRLLPPGSGSAWRVSEVLARLVAAGVVERVRVDVGPWRYRVVCVHRALGERALADDRG